MKELSPEKFIYVYGEVANAGTLLLIDEFDFQSYFSDAFLNKYKKIIKDKMDENTKLIKDKEKFFGTEHVSEITKGGIFTTLWDMAKKEKVGMDFSQKDIPISQATFEICNYIDVNPYRLYTKSSYLIFETFEWCTKFTSKYGKEKIRCIGKLYNKKECARVDGDTKAYLTKDYKDEINRVLNKKIV